MPRKPFHFEPESEEVVLVLFSAYLSISAVIEASTSTLEAAGLDASYARSILAKCDRMVVQALRLSNEE